MARPADFFEAATPTPVVALSNTASLASFQHPYFQTIDATTNYAVDATGSVARVRVQLRDGKGTAVQGAVHVSVGANLNSITLNNSTLNLGIAPPGGGTPYSTDFFAHTTGVVDVSFTFATAGAKNIVVQYGVYRVTVALTIT